VGEKLKLNRFGPGDGSGDGAVLLGSGEIIDWRERFSLLAAPEADNISAGV
jgi:hypothetical protein